MKTSKRKAIVIIVLVVVILAIVIAFVLGGKNGSKKRERDREVKVTEISLKITKTPEETTNNFGTVTTISDVLSGSTVSTVPTDIASTGTTAFSTGKDGNPITVTTITAVTGVSPKETVTTSRNQGVATTTKITTAKVVTTTTARTTTPKVNETTVAKTTTTKAAEPWKQYRDPDGYYIQKDTYYKLVAAAEVKGWSSWTIQYGNFKEGCLAKLSSRNLSGYEIAQDDVWEYAKSSTVLALMPDLDEISKEGLGAFTYCMYNTNRYESTSPIYCNGISAITGWASLDTTGWYISKG